MATDLDDLRTFHGGVDAVEKAIELVTGLIRELGDKMGELGYEIEHDLDVVAAEVDAAIDAPFAAIRGQLEADIQDAEEKEDAAGQD